MKIELHDGGTATLIGEPDTLGLANYVISGTCPVCLGRSIANVWDEKETVNQRTVPPCADCCAMPHIERKRVQYLVDRNEVLESLCKGLDADNKGLLTLLAVIVESHGGVITVTDAATAEMANAEVRTEHHPDSSSLDVRVVRKPNFEVGK